MKKYLAAAALAAALAQPASATTFPSLTTIYVASGVEDDGGGPDTGMATTMHCTNVSGVTTQIRIVVLEVRALSREASIFLAFTHGRSLRVSTHLTFFGVEANLATGPVQNGAINVESTQSGVFCTFAVVSAAVPAGGMPLHAVRVNPHPGTVE